MRILVLQLIQKKGEQKLNYFINSSKLMRDLKQFLLAINKFRK
jgi:hypothetical protein